MKKELTIITILYLFISGYCVLGAERSKPLLLVVDKNHIKITNGKMVVTTVPGKTTAYIKGPFGNFSSYGFDYPLAEIKVEKNTPQEKNVLLISKVQKTKSYGGRSAIFTLRLVAKIDSPEIKLQATIKNVGEYPAKVSFYYRLIGLKYPYYFNAEGWQQAAKHIIPKTNWIFLPSANTKGGYGLILMNCKNMEIRTLYPRADWQTVGLYFCAQGSKIKPNKTFSIGFKIFPAGSQWQVLKHYKKENLTENKR